MEKLFLTAGKHAFDVSSRNRSWNVNKCDREELDLTKDGAPGKDKQKSPLLIKRAVAAARRPTGSFRITGLSLFVGLVTGFLVVAIKRVVECMQVASLSFAADESLAPGGTVSFLKVAASLGLGALVVAALSAWLNGQGRRVAAREAPIDAVEANALRGGLMHARDGISVVVPILASVGFGASVGIEAAVTQVGSVLASMSGQFRRLPRSDLRLLVGAGAAAAISAAYDAPIAGMFYAFELVLGTYSTRMLGPVGLAAIASALLARAIDGGAATFKLTGVGGVHWPDYPLALLIGCLAAGTGVMTMLLVSNVERLLKRLFRRMALRLLTGGLVLATIATAFPLVLGSGHAAITETVGGHIVGIAALGLLVGKLMASVVSLGSGFRGGLFSASLLIGALLGQITAAIAAATASFLPGVPEVQPNLCAAIGMAAVGASIVGSPLAMIFLVIESSQTSDVAVIVAVGAVTASFMTNRLFGYSFATWRFQQRGLALDGGTDVSQLSAITIGSLVHPPKRSLFSDADVHRVVHAVSVAGGRGTAVYGSEGFFMGLIDPMLVEAIDGEDLPVVAAELVYESSPLVTPDTTLAAMLDLLRSDDRATFAVVNAKDQQQLVGCVRARDVYAAASTRLDAKREADLGVT